MQQGLRTFHGAIAVVTGGASGIGAALATELARRGAHVVLVDRQEPEARKHADAIQAEGGKAEALALDVRDAAAVEQVINDVFQRHGRLDFLFNNAGTGVGGEAKDYTLDDWRYVVEVNLMGVVHGIQAAYSRMVRQGFGHIVNTASISGFVAAPYTAVYGATKHAVVGLSRALRIEARVHGVRVSVVCPGVVRTPILVNGGRFGRMTVAVVPDVQRRTWESLRPIDADVLARRVLPQVARNRSIIVVPAWWRLIFMLNGLLPSLADAMVYRWYVRTKKELER